MVGSVAGVRALRRAIGNRATARVVAHSRVPACRSIHTGEDLFDMMQKFRSKNDHLSEAEQNKIFLSIKKATDSDEAHRRQRKDGQDHRDHQRCRSAVGRQSGGGDEGRLMAADFVPGFSSLSSDLQAR